MTPGGGDRRVVLATANPDKARELAAALPGFEVLPRPEELPDIEETEPDLEGNARLKAVTVARATRMAALADDTGLEVAALDGAPGVMSARWAGPGATYADNVAKLLSELGGTEDRRARFRTVLVLAYPDGTEVQAEGSVDGVIALAPRGGGGFGYDPVFVPTDGGGRTLAEMTLEEKQSLSHRGRAVRALAARLGA